MSPNPEVRALTGIWVAGAQLTPLPCRVLSQPPGHHDPGFFQVIVAGFSSPTPPQNVSIPQNGPTPFLPAGIFSLFMVLDPPVLRSAEHQACLKAVFKPDPPTLQPGPSLTIPSQGTVPRLIHLPPTEAWKLLLQSEVDCSPALYPTVNQSTVLFLSQAIL